MPIIVPLRIIKVHVRNKPIIAYYGLLRYIIVSCDTRRNTPTTQSPTIDETPKKHIIPDDDNNNNYKENIVPPF